MGNSKKKFMIVFGLSAIAAIGCVPAFALAQGNGLFLSSANSGEVWNHYVANEAKLNKSGTKEFWASCTNPGTRVFTRPTEGTIVEAGEFKEVVDATDDRYVPMTKSATVINSPIVADGVTLDEGKFGQGKTAVVLAATATGVDAIGTTFTLKETFQASDELVFDFRVFSEKGYVAADKTAAVTHTYPYWDASHPSQAGSLYSSDYFNPYMDLKEVTITMTSVANPANWVKCMIRGGAPDRADLSTMRVLTSADNAVGLGWAVEDGCGKMPLYGYGAQCDSGLPAWPQLEWDANCNGTRYTEVTGAFSNNVISGTSTGNLVKFSPQSGGYDFAGWNSTYYRNVRDCVGNWNINATGRAYGYNDMASGLFAGGYKVSITFSDVTDNAMVGQDISEVHSYENPGAGYYARYGSADKQFAQFTQAYARKANMAVYSITKGGSEITLTADSFVVD